jgi:hypothetical protein
MTTYILVAKARERGAIGMFYPVSFKIRAASSEKAREYFIEQVRCSSKVTSKYEINSIEQISVCAV